MAVFITETDYKKAIGGYTSISGSIPAYGTTNEPDDNKSVRSYGKRVDFAKLRLLGTEPFASPLAADGIQLFRLPSGVYPLFGVIQSTQAFAGTLAIGTSAVHAQNVAANSLRVGAALTANTPTVFQNLTVRLDPIDVAGEGTIFYLTSSANFPTTGTLSVDLIATYASL